MKTWILEIREVWVRTVEIDANDEDHAQCLFHEVPEAIINEDFEYSELASDIEVKVKS